MSNKTIEIKFRLSPNFNTKDFIDGMKFILAMKLIDVRHLPRKKKKAARKRIIIETMKIAQRRIKQNIMRIE